MDSFSSSSANWSLSPGVRQRPGGVSSRGRGGGGRGEGGHQRHQHLHTSVTFTLHRGRLTRQSRVLIMLPPSCSPNCGPGRQESLLYRRRTGRGCRLLGGAGLRKYHGTGSPHHHHHLHQLASFRCCVVKIIQIYTLTVASICTIYVDIRYVDKK